MGFSIVDVIVGACVQARHLIEALRAGDRSQVARAMSFETAQLAATGGRQSARERGLAETAASLTDKEGTVEAKAFFGGGCGLGMFTRGRWREAMPLLGQAARSVSVSGFELSRLFELYARLWMGELREAWKQTTWLSAMAEERGDLYTLVNLRTTVGVLSCLAAGDPERARRNLEGALALWTQSGFQLQHWQAVVYGAEIGLYAGEPERAYQAFVASMPALRRSLLLQAGFVRALTWSTLGRLAVASSDARPESRRARIADARRMVRKLDRERNVWVGGLARTLEASLENAAGNRAAAIAALRAGLERLEATDTGLYVLPARYRLGELLGGESGEALKQSALDSLVAQGIREPERWVRVYLPGTWSGVVSQVRDS